MSENGPDDKYYELKTEKGYYLLRFRSSSSFESAKAFENALPRYLKEHKDFHWLIDCSGLEFLNQAWLGCLMRMSNTLKTEKKLIRLMNVSDALGDTLHRKAVDRMLVVAETEKEALKEFGLGVASKLDVNFINPFLEVTVKVLRVQASLNVQSGKAHPMAMQEKVSSDVSGVLGLVSSGFSGTIVLKFPHDPLMKLMSRLQNEEYSTVTAEVENGVGDLMNTIFSQAKNILVSKGYTINAALPAVVSGNNHSVLNVVKGPRIGIPFYTEIGEFVIEICLSE